MLTYLGYSTLHAYGGIETLEIYKENMGEKERIKVVIKDLTIPGGMGGAVAIRQLRQLDPQAKAIVSSGCSDEPILQNYRDA